MTMIKKTVLLFLLALLNSSTGKRMRWIPSTDFSNPDNWEPRGTPCRNDHVTFPAKAPPVYVQTNQTLLELILPIDGEIVLAEGSILTFPETPDSSCSGKTVRFTAVTPKSWFDPINWCVTSDSSDECLTNQTDLLDTERIPCQSDDVVFAVGTGFFVDLQSDAEIRMASLKLGNEQMNTETFRSYLNSQDGMKQFIGQNNSNAKPTTVLIGGFLCTDVTGCICGNVRLQSRICAVQSIRCVQVSCGNAILPDGHCCHICGALLSLDYGTGFKLKNLRNLITDTFRKLNVGEDAVKTVISKLDNDRIQIVLESTTDDGEGAGQVGRSVKEELDRDPRYGAMRVNLSLSKSSPEAHKGDKGASAMGSGAIVGIIFAILIIAILLLTAAYCYRNKDTCHRPRLPEISLPSPPDFRRFFRKDNDRSNEPEFELRQHSVSFDNRVFEGNLSGFENPTYGDLFSSLQSDSQPEKGGFSNPMFATTTDQSAESKDSAAPPDYILYDVPPKEPSGNQQKAKLEAEQRKGEEKLSGSGTKDNADEPKKTDTLGKMLLSPFRKVTSKFRGTKLEEEDEDSETKEERPKEDAPGSGREEPEAEKKRARAKFGRSKDHERLEEIGVDGDKEGFERKGQKVEKKPVEEARGSSTAGFGNPLYGAEGHGAVVDTDLGEVGTTGSGAAADQTRRSRTGFENPLFEDSKESRSVPVAGATEVDDESTA